LTRKILITKFLQAVALGRGRVKNFGKSLIFEITSRLQDHRLHQPSNSIPANVSSSTTTSIGRLQSLQPPSESVDFVDEMIHSRLQAEPIQEEALRSVVDDDPVDDHFSEKIENQNVSDCVEFIRVTNCKTAPKLKIKFGSRLQINFCWG
jgi:hypothetical protein